MRNEIVQMLSIESGIPLENIFERSSLLGDLKIDGDDAWNVIEQCSERFNLDLTEFDFNEYFRCEPCFKGIIYYWRKVKYRDEHIAANKTPITVEQLITICRVGKWAAVIT